MCSFLLKNGADPDCGISEYNPRLMAELRGMTDIFDLVKEVK